MDGLYHFDKYECTFPGGNPDDILRHMQHVSAPREIKPVRGYGRGFDFGEGAVWVMYDGHSGQYGPHVIVQGGVACPALVSDLRTAFPEHRVSRVDVAADWDFPGAFTKIEGVALKVALERGLVTSVHGDYYGETKGRTLYVGSPKSTHRLRVYEKGYEQRQKGLNPDASVDWVRAEFQVRPSKKGEARSQAAVLSPDQVAASSAWTFDVSERLGGSCGGDVVKLTDQYTKSDVRRAFDFMLKQYAKTIRRLVDSGELSQGDVMRIFYRECVKSVVGAHRCVLPSPARSRELSRAIKEREGADGDPGGSDAKRRRSPAEIHNFIQYGTYEGLKRPGGES